VFGGLVALVYRRSRHEWTSATFPPTLVLLAVLIAMVTQVIGEKRRPGLQPGRGLAIVRFRTSSAYSGHGVS